MKTVLCLLFLPSLALANGGGYITGVSHTGAFQPIGIDQVEMLSERLEIDLHIEYADIRIDYVLHNPGKKVKIEAGFPSAIATTTITSSLPSGETTAKQPKLENFSLTVDGKAIKVVQTDDKLDLSRRSMTHGVIVNSWHRVKIEFAEGQTRQISVKYRNPYYYSDFSISDNGDAEPLSLTYLFSAAGAWHGPIGQGIVKIRNVSVPAGQISLSHPKRFTLEGSTYTWSFTDFEPTLEDDLVIITRPGYSFSPAVDTTGEETQWIGQYVGFNAKRNPKTGEKSGGKWEFQRDDYVATASSSLVDTETLNYQPPNVSQGRETAWAEGVSGDGVGESITLTLKKASPVKKIGIVNGYAKSAELYYANSRPAELDVSVNGGKANRVKIPDEYLQREMFFFDLSTGGELVKSVKLTIAKVYPGLQFSDTSISQVMLIQPLSKAPVIGPIR